MSGELFIEIRCEELPPSMIRPALDGLVAGLVALVDGIAHGTARAYATPRRLAVAIADVADARPLTERVVTGPPADRAYKDGVPTQAAIGFARGKGVDIDAITLVDTPKGKVIAVTVREGGESTASIVAAGLEKLVLGLPFGKSMAWGTGGVRWGRPFHGVAALYAGKILATTVAGLQTSNRTLGHRFAEDTEFSFGDSEQWLAGCRARFVEPDLDVRAAKIRAILDEVAEELGAEPIADAALEGQVLHLVEWPCKIIGTFEADLLHLPPRLLVESMKVHQRCFPVHIGGELTNKFALISNAPTADVELVADGFARVLRSRFFDARFFFAEDKKKPLETHGEKLSKMRWIRGLGTMFDKQARIAGLAARVAVAVGWEESAPYAESAGLVSKCDLVTQMVGEFPELQGHMGKLYALAEGLDPDVAIAIEEHYQPRFAGEHVAGTRAGAALSIADRLDTLVGCFGIGMAPKGGGDPQGLRRAALGLVHTVIRHGLRIDLASLFALAIAAFHEGARGAGFESWGKERGTGPSPKDGDLLVAQLVEFTLARFEAQAVADGASGDLVDAVIKASPADLVVLDTKVQALRAIAGSPDFLPIMHTFKRVINISRGAVASGDVGWTEPSERSLDAAFQAVQADVEGAIRRNDWATALGHVLTLRAPVAQFFDDVLVDDPDPVKKARRIGLLQRIGRTFLDVADFSRISTR